MNINLYPLTDSGRKLESLFFYEEIDEVTLKDSRELLMSELENKSSNIVSIFNNYSSYIGKDGLINKEIERLKNIKKSYEDKFESFKYNVTECMFTLGFKTGKSNGIMTEQGVLTLNKSQREVPVDINKLDDKYKKFTVTVDVSKEELEKLNTLFEGRLKISEPKLNKDLYKLDFEIVKETHYSVSVK